MIRVTAWFKDKKTVGVFHCLYDAIDFRDLMDANYPLEIEFKNGVFSMMAGSITAFGISLVAHAFLLAAIVITVATFELAKSKPSFFLDNKYHTPSRSRGYMWINGQRIKLDKNDPGGEHE